MLNNWSGSAGRRRLYRRHFVPLAPYLTICAAVCVLMLAVSATAQKKLPQKPVDLNSASAEDLQKLPNIGPVTAAAIIRFREKSGPFRRVEDLLVIRNMSQAKLDEIRPYVTVVPMPAKKSGG